MNTPRCAGSCELISTRTGWGRLIATLELSVSAATTVPFWLEKAFGSTDTVTFMGVVPLEGETVRPAIEELMLNGVVPPPGSVMVICCRVTLRLQKLPRNTTSSTDAFTRGALLILPTGTTRMPLSEIEYMVLLSLESTLLPARFSG